MAETSVMTDDELRSAIDSLTNRLRADKAANDAFCDCWPCARRLLNLLKTVVPEKIKAVIDVLIKIGNAVATAVCK